MRRTKVEYESLLKNIIADAKGDGIEIVVACDSEGNHYNSLNPDDMIYGDTNDNYIALAVWEDGINEEKIFNRL